MDAGDAYVRLRFMSSSPISVILDCDPGIDDALAVALLAAHPGVELVAITTVAGNVPLRVTTDNALRLREFYRIDDVPVYAGAEAPLRREPVFAGYVHGADGLGGAPVPAASRPADDGFGPDAIIELLRERGEPDLFGITDAKDAPFATDDELVTTDIDGSAYAEQARRALAAHRTQIDPNHPMFSFIDSLGPQARHDFYQLARGERGPVDPATGHETDLFAGIEAS